MSKRYLSLLALPLLLIPLLAPLPLSAQTFQEGSFPDVTPYGAESISYLKKEGIVEGYADGEFKESNRINRAEFTKILIEAVFTDEEIESCLSQNESEIFPDVPKDAWFAKYVCLAKEKGVIGGYPDGDFKPAEYINFAESGKILAEALNLEVGEAGTGEWFKKYVEALEGEGAIPLTIDFFDEEITRGDMAEMTYRLDAQIKTKPFKTYEELLSEFPAIASCSALKDKFAQYYEGYQHYPMPRPMPLMMEADEEMAADATQGASAPMEAPVANMAKTGGGSGSNDFSATNVQVEGVDEADVIKNDGQYIYMVRGNKVTIVEAYPSENLSETSSIEFTMDEAGFYPQELYVKGDTLVVIGQSSWWYGGPAIMNNGAEADAKIAPGFFPGYYSPSTTVYTYDLSDRQKPEQIRKVQYGTHYTNSRMIGDNLYMIMNASPNIWGWSQEVSGNDLLPEFSDGEKEAEPLMECDEIRYFPGQVTPEYLVISGMNVNDPDSQVSREVFLGSSGNVYASAQNLYVTATQFDPFLYADWNWEWESDKVKSLVYRFALEDGQVEFAGRGEVPGTILNQFSMDEKDDYFRIATTKGDTWNEANPSTNNLYTLHTGTLEQAGKLEGLAPGERIYSVRFMGDRAYMVTFRQVDPLFVIDLEDQENPKVLGQLKIPGFSNYLHPYDEDHLIGFGSDTQEEKNGQVTVGGMKLALFDVSDVQNPTQKFSEVIGDQGTYSELLHNNKALLFDKERELPAFPVSVMEKFEVPEGVECEDYVYETCPSGCQQRCVESCFQDPVTKIWSCEEDCNGPNSCVTPYYDHYENTFSGAYVYSLNAQDGFQKRGEITHYTADDLKKAGDYLYNHNKTIQRIVRIGENLYTVAQGSLKATDLESLQELNYLELEGGGWEDGVLDEPTSSPAEPAPEEGME